MALSVLPLLQKWLEIADGAIGPAYYRNSGNLQMALLVPPLILTILGGILCLLK